MPNPQGLYSRIKTWAAGDTILAADLNAEFDNVLSNFNPEMLAGYSQNQAQMQVQTAPGAVGSESLAQAISGELERLRYQIAAITGNTYWYSAPAATLAQLNSIIGASAFGNRISSGTTSGTTGSTMPAFLVAAGSGTTATLKATSVAFSYQVAGVPYSIAADTTVALTLGGTGSTYNATVNDLTLVQAGTASTVVVGENGSQITVSSMGGSMSAVVGQLVGLKTTAGEYMLGRVESATQIQSCMRGFFFDSSSVLVSRGTIANGDILQLMGTTWIFANTTGTVSGVYNKQPRAGGVAPLTPANGDYWYDTSVNLWKTYTGTVWAASNSTLIGIALTDSSNCVATRSFDFFANYSDLNNLELFADSQNSGTIVRSRLQGPQVSVYGTLLNYGTDYVRWDFSTALDTGSQAASTLYYFYLDTNGRSWISKVAPNDRRSDLRGYYHPGKPWRCFGYGWSNAATLLDNVESFYVGDSTAAVSNITAANNNIILPYNIVQREEVITVNANASLTQVLPPPAQLKGKFLTYIRADNDISKTVTLQSWGTAVANYTGTCSTTTNPTVLTGLSSTVSLSAGMLITGLGIPPNTTLSSSTGSVGTMSNSATLSLTNGTFNFANSAGYLGTVGQQPAYSNYGINGQFTFPMITQYESVTITSDGYAYYIVNRYIPSNWTAYTPSFSAGWGTVTNIKFSWRRDGQDVLIQGAWTMGTGAGSGATIPLPPNMTSASNGIMNTGYFTVVADVAQSAVNAGAIYLIIGAASTSLSASQSSASQNGLTGQNGNGFGTNTQFCTSNCRVPIAGWTT